jgi:hypothetical protein
MIKNFIQWLQGPAYYNSKKSDLDKFIHEFEAQRTIQPASRIKEKEKSDRISAYRDRIVIENKNLFQ